MAKLKVEFSQETSEILKRLAAADSTSAPEIIQRSLALYKLMSEKGLMKSGAENTISIMAKDGKKTGSIQFKI